MSQRQLNLFLFAFLCVPLLLSASCCWKGISLIGQLGGSWIQTDAKFTNRNYFNTLGPELLGSNFDFNATRCCGGGALAYNCQKGRIVFGAEVGTLGFSLKKTRPSPFFPTIDTYTSNIKWLINTRVRLGYAYKRLLGYVSGGWAGGDTALTLRDPNAGIFAHSKKWMNGWVVGFGTDYKLSRCFAAGIAYDYIQLRDHHQKTSCQRCGAGIGLGSPVVNRTVQIQSLTVRFSYFYPL